MTNLSALIDYMRAPDRLYARVDDEAGGRIQALKRRIKFRIRWFLYRRAIRQLFSGFIALGLDAALVKAPHTLIKLLRSYIDCRLDVDQRVQAQLFHYRWAIARWGARVVESFLSSESRSLWRYTFDNGSCELILCKATRMAREGELEIRLVYSGVVLESLAFSVIPDPQSPQEACVWVGGVQGALEQRELTKALTQQLARLRPTTVLVIALKAFSVASEVKRIYAVGDNAHVFSRYRLSLRQRRKRIYDQLWREMEAENLDGACWVFSPKLSLRSPAEVKSQKRSELQRKNRWKQQIFEEVACQIQTLTAIPQSELALTGSALDAQVQP